jgi:hypothetical protein
LNLLVKCFGKVLTENINDDSIIFGKIIVAASITPKRINHRRVKMAKKNGLLALG